MAHDAPLKSQIVFAPAGSGKTERLSQRYIDLLTAGVKPERILTLTFTEKAAAEMKERILRRLADKDPALCHSLRENILKLRIATIHSFCLSLLRRFAPLLGLDPRLDVLTDPFTLWQTTKYDTLLRIAQQERGQPSYRQLLALVTEDQVQGWPSLSQSYDRFFGKRTAIVRSQVARVDYQRWQALALKLRDDPIGKARIPDYDRLFPDELTPKNLATVQQLLEKHQARYLTKTGTPLKKGCTPEEQQFNARLAEYRTLILTAVYYQKFGQAFDLFQHQFLDAYTRAKRQAGQVDYEDMEYLALRLLTENPEWQNILYAFDEHTDHLLVDEFQDTSFLQWGIIDKLTEEWRAGAGVKTELGITPTIFIVGDDKQSIYLFRDAKVEVFAHAQERLEQWLGPDKLERLEPQDNYRSLEAIITFTNHLFAKLMAAPATAPSWQTRYRPFQRRRNNPALGRVEIILDRFEGKASECRAREAETIARRIQQLVNPGGGLTIYECQPDHSENPRLCRFADIAIVIRDRKNLVELETALRNAGIPFLVLGGTGFYQEPEIRYAVQLLRFLVDPCDDLALYSTLRGPIFNVPERDILLANEGAGLSFWARVQTHQDSSPPLRQARQSLTRWLSLVHYDSLSTILSQAFEEQKLWLRCWEPQRQANLRKFLALIEEKELQGQHPLRIITSLEQAGEDEPKADVRTEGANAVQILTVHAAKGLQFPVVFHPSLNRKLPRPGTSGAELVIEETGPDAVTVSHIPDPQLRSENPFHQEHIRKELEEEKRIFYVACTRAQDALFLTGTWNEKSLHDTPLAWLVEHLGLGPLNPSPLEPFRLSIALPGVSCLASEQIPEPAPITAESKSARPRAQRPKPAPAKSKSARPRAQRLIITPPPPLPKRIQQITRNIPKDYRHPAPDWLGLGDVIHALLQWISEQETIPDDARTAAEIDRLLRVHGLPSATTALEHSSTKALILNQLSRLKQHPEIWAVICPRPDARSEMPVMVYIDETLYTGRIDRVIITEDEVRIYDYKTFPVRKQELPGLAREYHAAQLAPYADALSGLYPDKKVSTFLIFTHIPALICTGEKPPATPET